jgi:hypothetical protein
MSKLKNRIVSSVVGLGIMFGGGVALADSASASAPGAVPYRSACKAGHTEGIYANRTVYTFVSDNGLYCVYNKKRYSTFRLVENYNFSVKKIYRICGAFICAPDVQ